MDANAFLFWSGMILCGSIGARAALTRSRNAVSWIAATAMLIAAGWLSEWVWPAYSGIVLGAACALFVVLPVYAQTRTSRFLSRRRYDAARRSARIAAFFHPSKRLRETPKYVDVLERIALGKLDAAALRDLDESTTLGRFAYAHVLRVAGRWREMTTFIESVPVSARMDDPNLAVLYLRGLLELGELEALLAEYARLEQRPAFAAMRELLGMMTAARVGRVDLVDRLSIGRTAVQISSDTRAYWRAVALQTAGRPESRDALVELIARAEPDTRRGAERRLAEPFAKVDPSALSAEARAVLHDIELESASAVGLAHVQGRSPATWLLLASLVGVFLLELPGGSTNLRNLVKLGALVIPPSSSAAAFPGPDGTGGLYRVVTAAWLHFGVTHLVANSLGLVVFGRRVESAFGSWKLVVLFAGSAVLGNVTALLLLSGPMALVGASGGVLGLLGAMLAVVLRRRQLRRTRFLQRRIWEALLIVGVQVAFDWMTPAVSSTVHLAGFVSGLLLGLVVPPRSHPS